MYVKPPERVELCPSGFVTTTLTEPAACAGAVAVSEVEELKVTPVLAVPPNVTVAPLTKSVPVMFTDVPPAAGPLFGDADVTAGGDATGAASTVMARALVAV